MQIALFIYDHFTALDAIGPYEVLSRLPGAEVTFVAREAGPVRCDTGFLTVVADASIDEVTAPDILFVPGWSGAPQTELLTLGPVHEWLRSADAHTAWTTSACTGALILAAAGLIEGRRATTHWLATDELRALGAVPVDERVVRDGKFMTAAGVSAGIDMALTLAAELAGGDTARAIQLGIEYDPQPPFDCGSPHKAATEPVAAMRAPKHFVLYGHGA
jgi:putative intracellular protease/amidase